MVYLTWKKELFLKIVALFLGISMIVFAFKNNLLLSSILILILMIGIKYRNKGHNLVYFITGAIIGPFAEIICIHFGVWQYTNPSFLGIPLWLPFAWGFAIILIKSITQTIINIDMK